MIVLSPLQTQVAPGITAPLVRRRRVVVYQFEHSASVWPQGVVVLRDVGAEVWRLKRDNHSGITVWQWSP